MEAGGAFVAHADWLFSCQSSVGDYSLHTLRASLPGTFSEEGCKPALGVRSLYCVLRTATPRQLDFLPEGGTIVSTETIGIWFYGFVRRHEYRLIECESNLLYR